MRYIIEFDRFGSSSGGTRYWAETPYGALALVQAIAKQFSSLYFSLFDSSTHFLLSGGSVECKFCLFQTLPDPGQLAVYTLKDRGDTTLIEIIDQRCPHIFFIPRTSFVSYDELVRIAEMAIKNKAAAKMFVGQRFSDIGFPDGPDGDLLIDKLVDSDLSDDAKLPGRWEFGVGRVLSIA